MKSKLLVANMKTYMNLDGVKNYLNNIEVSDNVIFCPSYIYIPYFLDKGLVVGAQDAMVVDDVITGEISFEQISDINVSYVILGHSERRQYFNKNNNLINKKVMSALKNKMKVILCVGETKQERENKQTTNIIEKQINECLLGVSDIEDIIIAYEPRWVIGGTNIPSVRDIDEVIIFIKEVINKKFNTHIDVIYGGSVNEKNIDEINKLDSLDGFLVGKASCDATKFNQIKKSIG